jgi:hypothetical protein
MPKKMIVNLISLKNIPLNISRNIKLFPAETGLRNINNKIAIIQTTPEKYLEVYVLQSA